MVPAVVTYVDGTEVTVGYRSEDETDPEWFERSQQAVQQEYEFFRKKAQGMGFQTLRSLQGCQVRVSAEQRG